MLANPKSSIISKSTISKSRMQLLDRSTPSCCQTKVRSIPLDMDVKMLIYWWKSSWILLDQQDTVKIFRELYLNQQKLRLLKVTIFSELQQVVISVLFLMKKIEFITGEMASMLSLEMETTKILIFLISTNILNTSEMKKNLKSKRSKVVNLFQLLLWIMENYTVGVLTSTDRWELRLKLEWRCMKLSTL